MGESLQPKIVPYGYEELLYEIEHGTIKLPKFQREFVWKIEESAELLDSVIKGYPVGTFTIWQTQERLANIKNIAGYDIPDTRTGYPVKYVLDGQQRLTSIFVSLKGLTIKNNDYKNIFINLDESSEKIISVDKPSRKYITVSELLQKDMEFFSKNHNEHINIINNYQNRFKNYKFSVIELHGYAFDKAVDIFTKINTTGRSLKLFDIISAKTYDEKTEFDLAKNYEDLQKELDEHGYSIPSQILLQSISINLIQNCKRKDILQLKKEDIIKVYDETVIAIKKAIEYFIHKYTITASKLLPYDSIIIPFQYFYFENKNDPNLQQAKWLQEYFWKASLSSRFTSAVEAKLEQDYKRIENILHDIEPNFSDLKIPLSAKDIEDHAFSTGESVCKSVLCMLSSLRPKTFNINKDVTLHNSTLSQSSSKNYHHFFPKAYLKKSKNANIIANITLTNASENLKIGSKSPAEYIKIFEDNPDFSKTLKTHLIGDLDSFGINSNDFELFLRKRSELIWQELEKRINPS